MRYFPFFFKLDTFPILLVGGGEIALRKYQLLKQATAKITVLAPEIEENLAKEVENNGDLYVQDSYQSAYLANHRLVIAATDDAKINTAVAADARRLGIPVNAVDMPELCDFIFPAIVDRNPLLIAISSAGVSPVLARLLRAKIESIVPPTFGDLVNLLDRFRAKIRAKFPTIEFRRAFYEDILQGKVADLALNGNSSAAESQLSRQLESADPNYFKGEVYLVGAGCGDPDLLTFKALRLMQQADVVLYDRLVHPQIVDLCRRDAEKIPVGKEKGYHSVPQSEINQMLVDLAKSGKRVLRLKGGDPFIFGRGGEEAQALAAHQIPFQIVPGITAALGAAAYTGVPLTHRDFTQSVLCTAVHAQNLQDDIFWKSITAFPQTIVFYMGVHVLADVVAKLIANGLPADTPISIVSNTATTAQKQIIGTLSDIVAQFQENPLPAPNLMIVGAVVGLSKSLNWFQNPEENPPAFSTLINPATP